SCLSDWSSDVCSSDLNGLVAKALFSIPQERRRYLERVASLLTNECRVANLHRKVDRRASQLRAALARQPGLRAQFGAAVDDLKQIGRASCRGRVEKKL